MLVYKVVSLLNTILDCATNCRSATFVAEGCGHRTYFRVPFNEDTESALESEDRDMHCYVFRSTPVVPLLVAALIHDNFG